MVNNMKRAVITKRPLNPLPLIKKVRKDEYGAVVVFLGVVRNESEGRRVVRLEYEAYKEMAERKLEEIIQEAEEKWGIKDMIIVHRVGMLDIGEASLLVVAGSPHRAEAFDACQYAISRLKEIAPIWKKEIFSDGEAWVGPQI